MTATTLNEVLRADSACSYLLSPGKERHKDVWRLLNEADIQVIAVGDEGQTAQLEVSSALAQALRSSVQPVGLSPGEACRGPSHSSNTQPYIWSPCLY